MRCFSCCPRVKWPDVETVLPIFLVVLMAFVLSSTASITNETSQIQTESGFVSGIRLARSGHEVDAYLGVPYAESPVGQLRFRRPWPKLPWQGVHNATSKPSPCWQLDDNFMEDFPLNYSHASEDCLYLNIWRRALNCTLSGRCDTKRPVVVFIQGSAFQWGDSSLYRYDAANFVALSDLVCVTLNYRLSIFGFLSNESPEVPGNMGLWDQNLALRWVRRNIENFGGDPSDVTLVGHSVGGTSAGFHIASPQSKGLFRRVVMQSGTPLSSLVHVVRTGAPTFTSVAKTLGCFGPEMKLGENFTNVASCLRGLDAAFIMSTLRAQGPAKSQFSPIFGDEFLPSDPLLRDTWKAMNIEQIMLGTTLNESTVFIQKMKTTFPRLVQRTNDDYRVAATVAVAGLLKIPLIRSTKIVAHYFGDYSVKHDIKMVISIFCEMLGDIAFYCPTQLFAEIATHQGVRTYRYIFAHRSSGSLSSKISGVSHGEDIPYTLGSLSLIHEKEHYTPALDQDTTDHISNINYNKEEERFVKQIVSAWTTFVENGKPVVQGSETKWPLYTEEDFEILYLLPNNFTRAREPKRDRCELWKPYLLKH